MGFTRSLGFRAGLLSALGVGADSTSSKRSRVAISRSAARSTSAHSSSPRSSAPGTLWARIIR